MHQAYCNNARILSSLEYSNYYQHGLRLSHLGSITQVEPVATKLLLCIGHLQYPCEHLLSLAKNQPFERQYKMFLMLEIVHEGVIQSFVNQFKKVLDCVTDIMGMFIQVDMMFCRYDKYQSSDLHDHDGMQLGYHNDYILEYINNPDTSHQMLITFFIIQSIYAFTEEYRYQEFFAPMKKIKKNVCLLSYPPEILVFLSLIRYEGNVHIAYSSNNH